MKKKLLYIGILIALVGLLGPVNVSAQTLPEITTTGCYNTNTNLIQGTPPYNQAECQNKQTTSIVPLQWVVVDGTPTPGGGSVLPATGLDGQQSPLEQELDKACGKIINGSIGGCLAYLFYYIFYALPAFLLAQVARFFDFMLSLTLSSAMYGSFISDAWKVVRDISNIFFILVLLYIAVKIILGIGGSEVKKMIARVVIMALLINFSMFFSKVVVDTSNILALVFYNRIATTTTVNGVEEHISQVPILNRTKVVQDKPIAATMMTAFDPSRLLTPEFFDKITERGTEFDALSATAAFGAGALAGSFVTPIVGTLIGGIIGTVGWYFSSGSATVPVPMLLGIIFVTGSILIFAAYSFFIAGLSFVGRLVELWILIIFSPFAFMSSTIPILAKVKYIGWDEWVHRLLKTSFMAPIFMLFLYLIAKIIQADPIGSVADRATFAQQGWQEAILLLAIPALIILILLVHATKFAKEGGGEIGQALIKGTKIAGGLALGGAIGGAALVGTKTLGAASSAVASSRFASGKGALSRGLRRTAQYGSRTSFDLRKTGIGTLTKKLGVDLDSSKAIGLGVKEGGYEKIKADKVKRGRERAQQLEVGEDEVLKQKLNNAEARLQSKLHEFATDLEDFDRDIKSAQENFDAAGPAEKQAKADELNRIRKAKSTFKQLNGITNLEKTIIPGAKLDIANENRGRKRNYANAKTRFSTIKVPWFGSFNNPLASSANREAAHKIIMEEKLDSGTKTA